jgi:uncharacterized heparinase superfamily protein
MIVRKLSLYFHTIRHLKFSQIFWRIFRRLKVIDTSAQHVIDVRDYNNWHRVRLSSVQIVDRLSFNFLNRKHVFVQSVDWNTNDQEMLWLFNLHYFDDLNAPFELDRNTFMENLLVDWIENNPPLDGVGWEAYPLSLRIVNIIKWILNGQLTKPDVLYSLKRQTHILSQLVEYHLYGNHILANAKALIFSGLFFKGKQAEGWLDLGLKIFDEQLNEQILSDGGHFELSSMYQNIMLNDLLDLINISESYSHPKVIKFIDHWRSKASLMLTWADTMKHPDGKISFFNDAAFGIAPSHEQLNDYARAIGVCKNEASKRIFKTTELTSLSESGYFRVEQPNLVAILDCAAIGPDYIPGHGHADTLSFELSLQNFRVLVNSGTSCYGTSLKRLGQRGTAAHNTVTINGLDSSQVWSGFRVAKRAYPFGLMVDRSVDGVNISCSHDGYRRLKKPVVHNRVWGFSADTLTITDRLIGKFKTGSAHYLFHPDIQIYDNNNCFTLVLPNEAKVTLKISGGKGRLIETFWHSEFGKSVASLGMVVEFTEDVVVISIKGFT